MPPAISIEDVPEKTAVEIGRAVNPIKNRRSDAHIDLHHNGVVVMGLVMSARGVDDRTVDQKPDRKSVV